MVLVLVVGWVAGGCFGFSLVGLVFGLVASGWVGFGLVVGFLVGCWFMVVPFCFSSVGGGMDGLFFGRPVGGSAGGLVGMG